MGSFSTSLPRRRDQRGFTLVELLLAMTMSLVTAGAALTMLGTASKRNVENTERADSLNRAQIALERMGRDLRQANWLRFTSSQIVDLDVLQRDPSGGAAVRRHVRYDCSADKRCVRYEGPPTAYPPPASATFDAQAVVLTDVIPRDVFVPQRLDPATGQVVRDFLTPTSVSLAVELDLFWSGQPLRLEDGITLRNATAFRS